jgi:hypothetical protein
LAALERSLLERFIRANTAAKFDEDLDGLGPSLEVLLLLGDLWDFCVPFDGEDGGDWTLLCLSPNAPLDCPFCESSAGRRGTVVV